MYGSENAYDRPTVKTTRARALADRLVRYVASDGPTPVAGGAEGEVLHLLDFTPYADAPSRMLFTTDAVAADLVRLAGQQEADGGWTVDYQAYCPAAALEWRSYATIQAIATLRGAAL
jgi:hypothetical protein